MATQPVSPDRIERALTLTERRLVALEDAALARLVDGLRAAVKRLDAQLAPTYRRELASLPAGRSLREMRARELARQVADLLRILPAGASASLTDLIAQATALGTEQATTLIRMFEPEGSVSVRSFASVPREAITAAANNSYARLVGHGEEFARAASRSIIGGLTTGRSYRAVASELRVVTGVARHAAERIIRTESASALNTGILETYQDHGVQWVAWFSTLDQRVCKWCASRAGVAWEVGKSPVPPAHPNCRCRLVVDGPKYRELGLIDLEFARRHSAGTMRKAGITRRTFGPTAFEVKGGQSFGSPVWTP